MPFRSKAQQRWAFATHQPFAKEWADMTKAQPGGIRGLPERAGVRAHSNAHSRASAGRTGTTSNRRRQVPYANPNANPQANPSSDNDADDQGGRTMARKPPLGSGQRFKALSAKLGARGAHDPDALAAYIGRKKYGNAKMASMSKKGRG